MTVSSYHDLETSTFERVRTKTLTRIHGKPSWHQLETLIQECEEAALDCETSYEWSQDYGLLAEIQEPERYLATTGLIYNAPEEPPIRHSGIHPTTTAHRVALLTAENDVARHDWAIVKGFRRAISTNIRDALDLRYHNQLKHRVLHYRNVHPRQYITHLKTVWVILDERIKDELTKNYYRGWNDTDEHITGFAIRLDDEQAKLASDGLQISNVDKLQHYMLQMWNCSLFDQQTMTEWTIKPNVDKTYANAVSFFNEKVANLEAYEAASGGANNLESANAAVEIAGMLNAHKATTEAAAAALHQRDQEHALAMKTLRNEMATHANSETKQLRQDMAQLTALVQAMATTSPKKRRRTTKAVTFKGDSDSESDDDEPPTPPPAKKPRRQTKHKNRKKVWEEGGKWQPGMDFDREWKRSKGRAYAKAKWEYCNANPVWAKADRIEQLEKKLAREKGSE
jgi:hypothetical protein